MSEDSNLEIDPDDRRVNDDHEADFEDNPTGGSILLIPVLMFFAIGLILFLAVGTNTDRKKSMIENIKTIEYENHLFLIYDRSMTHDPNCHCVSGLETDTPGLVQESVVCGYQQGLMTSQEYQKYLDKREKVLEDLLDIPGFRLGN